MAYDAFLKLKGVGGEATAAGHEGEINIESFSWGVENGVSRGASGGFGAGKAELSEITITKVVDKSSTTLFQSAATGKHFPAAYITCRKAGEKPLEYLKYEFDSVFITSVKIKGDQKEDDTPTEEISFAFGKIVITYTPQNKDGSAGSPLVGTFDKLAGTAGS